MRNEPFLARSTRLNSRRLRLLALLPLLALSSLAQAQFTYTTNNGALTLAAYSGSAGSVTIPDQVYGLPVTGIGASAFAQSLGLTTVTITTNVNSIGSSAFAGCANLAALFFQGNAPTLADASVFHGDSATAYYESANAATWSSSFGGLPALLLDPQSLLVSITPTTAIADGAKWQVDGGSWEDSGAVVSNLALGNHTVSFNTLKGWTTPPNQTVTITSGEGTVATGLYTFPDSYGLVLNGGFETGDFSGWTLTGVTNGDTLVDNGSSSGIIPQSGSYEAALGQSGSIGSLSQTIATTAGANYLLSFWLECDGQITNEFLVSWSGKTLWDAKNLPDIGWTNMQLLVTATASSTVLQFGFRDDATYLGLDDVSVVPAAANAGGLQVTLLPAGAIISGAQWQVDGGTLQPSGATVYGLAAGNHTLSFTPIPGWATPTNQVVSIKNAQTSIATGTYAFLNNYGLVTNGGFENGKFSGWSFNGDPTANIVDDDSQTGIPPQSGHYEAAMGQSGSIATLSQALATTPGMSYSLSFWLDCSDGKTPNEFAVSWNGTILLDEVNLPATGWTNMQFVVGTSAASTVLQFDFRDDNSYLELDDVTVSPISTPVSLTGVGIHAGQFGFTITGTRGQTCIVEATSNLANPVWAPIQTNTLSGGSFSFTDPQGTSSRLQFYRVKLQ